MPSMNLSITGAIAGLPATSKINRTATGGIAQSPTMPKANAAVLTTRSSEDSGVVTLTGSHGIEVGDFIDIYHGTTGLTFDAVVTNVTGAAVTFDNALGGELPPEDDAVIVAKTVMLDTDFDPGYMQAIFMRCPGKGRVGVYSSDGHRSTSQIYDGEPSLWWKSRPNQIPPLAALMPSETVDFMRVSHTDTTKPQVMNIGVVYDSEIAPSSSTSSEG